MSYTSLEEEKCPLACDQGLRRPFPLKCALKCATAKVALCNSVILDMSGGFLLLMLLYLWPMLLLVVGWITVTHFLGVSLSSIFVNYSASKTVQLESYQIPGYTLV